jgi:hypothetical protein
LKTFSYEDRVSEWYTRLAHKIIIILRQKGSQEDRLEGFPHDVEVMKPGKGVGAQ